MNKVEQKKYKVTKFTYVKMESWIKGQDVLCACVCVFNLKINVSDRIIQSLPNEFSGFLLVCSYLSIYLSQSVHIYLSV